MSRRNFNLLGRKSMLQQIGESVLGERYPQREARTPQRPKRVKKTGSAARDSGGWSREEAEKALKAWNKKYRINPAPCASTIKDDDVTDRAKRYRANQLGCLPDGPKVCALCPARDDLMVDHKDGNESNGRKSNLRWLCRSCNTTLGAFMAKHGKGKRTKQFNPGADTLGAYMAAIAEHSSHYVPGKGRVGAHDEGGRIIHETPKSRRRKFASEIAGRKYGRSRGNPEDAAAELAEAWHGRPAKTATDVIEQVRFHGILTDLGRLKEIKIRVSDRKAQAIHFDEKTRLASSENGKQLYVVGGDQSLDLGAFGIENEEAEKDCVVIGDVYSVTYVTAKEHLGRADKTPGPYEHMLGEDGGEAPILVYDTLNESVGFAGGSYFINPTDYDGKHSAGIRN